MWTCVKLQDATLVTSGTLLLWSVAHCLLPQALATTSLSGVSIVTQDTSYHGSNLLYCALLYCHNRRTKKEDSPMTTAPTIETDDKYGEEDHPVAVSKEE